MRVLTRLISARSGISPALKAFAGFALFTECSVHCKIARQTCLGQLQLWSDKGRYAKTSRYFVNSETRMARRRKYMDTGQLLDGPESVLGSSWAHVLIAGRFRNGVVL